MASITELELQLRAAIGTDQKWEIASVRSGDQMVTATCPLQGGYAVYICGYAHGGWEAGLRKDGRALGQCRTAHSAESAVVAALYFGL